MTGRTAVVTGITGQDGAYLSRLLLDQGYRVIGLMPRSRRSSLKNLQYLKIADMVGLRDCDLLDSGDVRQMIRSEMPDEIYNLAAQSSVMQSYADPYGTFEFNVRSVSNLLESVRIENREIKIYQASSSEMYGKVEKLPITESTPMHPLSPYAVSKAASHWLAVNYRERYGLFCCCGICFNHESFLRQDNFFVKKAIRELLDVRSGKRARVEFGNLGVKRDFGFAPRYVEAMWKMMQAGEPDDYLICSGRSIQLREIVDHILDRLDVPPECVSIDAGLIRPMDISDIYGDNGKARKNLGWQYDEDFRDILDLLIDEEMRNQNPHPER
jgi:GDPmannose 4,6-dehydratase